MFRIERSNLYTAWLLERSAIDQHKWYMSERAGFDVGWASARWDWDMRMRAGWISGMRERGMWPA
jgi:hypothetical protein